MTYYHLDLLYSCWLGLLFSLGCPAMTLMLSAFLIYILIWVEIHWFPEKVFKRSKCCNFGCLYKFILPWNINGSLSVYGIILWKFSLWILEVLSCYPLTSDVLLRCLIPLWFLMLWMKSDFSLCRFLSLLYHYCYKIMGSCALIWFGLGWVYFHSMSNALGGLFQSWNSCPVVLGSFLEIFYFSPFIFLCFLFWFSSYSDVQPVGQSSNFLFFPVCLISLIS